MIVDPAMLAALARILTDHAGNIRRAGNPHRTGPWYDLERLPSSLPGSELAAASTEAVPILTAAFDVLAGPIDQMAYLAGSGAAGYTITVDAFTARLHAMGDPA